MNHKTQSTTNAKRINTKFLVIFSLILVVFSGLPKAVGAAGGSLYLAPSKGTFLVGSTFNVSIFVDTKGNDINALEVGLKFPADIIQVTTPTAGESFISEWLTPPAYSNIGGFINFKGGMPEGIITTAGLVSTVTFRAKSSGKARIEFLNSSKILLKDGKGTPVPTTNLGGVYEILIPPPEGPKITSAAHPDSDIWYSDQNPSFSWEKKGGVSDFSFSFSQNPQEIPDGVSEGLEGSISYSEVSDGIWYFHLRAKEEETWGRTSHFQTKIDANPPQEFELGLDLSNQFVYFKTRDFHSGLEHYEISVLNITQSPIPAPFFIEATSPFKIPYEEPGKYSVIVRAYDKAGNWQTAEVNFQVISPIISHIEGRGLEVKGVFLFWWVVYLILFILMTVIIYIIFYFSRRKIGFRKGIKEIGEALQEIEKIEKQEREVKRLKEEFKEEREKLEEKLSQQDKARITQNHRQDQG